MFNFPVTMFSSAGGGYVANAVDNGGTAYMLRGGGLTGAADSKTGLLSFWTRLDGGNGADKTIIVGDSNQVRIERNGSNKFAILARNSGASMILDMRSLTSYTAGAAWINVQAAWNLATGATEMYVNGVDDKNTITATNDTIDYTLPDWGIANRPTGLELFDGCFAEVYFAPGQYLDLSDSANRLKFRSAGGKPVDLGSDGSLPTGVAPLIYLKGVAASYGTNSGTGGDFSISGTFTTASTSPSN